MSTDLPGDRSGSTNLGKQRLEASEQTLPIYAEELEVSRRRVATALVRATRTTHNREQLINEELTHERVEVERVPIGRVVDAVPPVREEGDTTILSVVEEVVVVERRLVLKEEVHFRRVKIKEHHAETIIVREQQAAVTRTSLGGSLTKRPSPDLSPPNPTHPSSAYKDEIL